MEEPKLQLQRYRKTIKQGDELVSIVSHFVDATRLLPHSQIYMRCDLPMLQVGSHTMQQDELHSLVKFAEQGNLNRLRAMHLVRTALALLLPCVAR